MYPLSQEDKVELNFIIKYRKIYIIPIISIGTQYLYKCLIGHFKSLKTKYTLKGINTHRENCGTTTEAIEH